MNECCIIRGGQYWGKPQTWAVDGFLVIGGLHAIDRFILSAGQWLSAVKLPSHPIIKTKSNNDILESKCSHRPVMEEWRQLRLCWNIRTFSLYTYSLQRVGWPWRNEDWCCCFEDCWGWQYLTRWDCQSSISLLLQSRKAEQQVGCISVCLNLIAEMGSAAVTVSRLLPFWWCSWPRCRTSADTSLSSRPKSYHSTTPSGSSYSKSCCWTCYTM